MEDKFILSDYIIIFEGRKITDEEKKIMQDFNKLISKYDVKMMSINRDKNLPLFVFKGHGMTKELKDKMKKDFQDAFKGCKLKLTTIPEEI